MSAQEPALQAAQTTSDVAVASVVLARTLPSTSLPHIVTAVQTSDVPVVSFQKFAAQLPAMRELVAEVHV